MHKSNLQYIEQDFRLKSRYFLAPPPKTTNLQSERTDSKAFPFIWMVLRDGTNRHPDRYPDRETCQLKIILDFFIFHTVSKFLRNFETFEWLWETFVTFQRRSKEYWDTFERLLRHFLRDFQDLRFLKFSRYILENHLWDSESFETLRGFGEIFWDFLRDFFRDFRVSRDSRETFPETSKTLMIF